MSSFADVQDVIASRHGVPPTGRRALLSRLRHLNAADFPPGTRVGPGRRADYRVDDLFAFSMWFALAEAFVPPTVVSRLVRDCWPELVRAMLTAAGRDARVGGLDLGGSSGTVAVIVPYALDFVKGGPRGSGRGAVGAGSWELRMEDAPALVPAPGALLVVDVAREVRTMLDRFADAEGRLKPAIVNELRTVAAEQGWARPGVAQPLATVVDARRRTPLSEGDRLGDADHFFGRAIELLGSRADGEDDDWTLDARSARHLAYLAEPFRREGWKRQLEVAGVPFLYALWAHLGTGAWEAPLPATLQVAVLGRLPEDAEQRRDLLVAAAEDARDKEVDGAPREVRLPTGRS